MISHIAYNVHSGELDKQEFHVETVRYTRINVSHPPTNRAFVKALAVYFVSFTK